MSDAGMGPKRFAPAAARNREAILQVLADELPAGGLVLEIASGTGEHVAHFAHALPGLTWQPSDVDASSLRTIAAWRADALARGVTNILPPVRLDACGDALPGGPAPAAIVCINMVHISPPEATEGLFRLATGMLAPGQPLVLYGPFLEEEKPTAKSNLAFGSSLRARDARWGLREVRWLDVLALDGSLQRTRRVEMPANNLMLVYRRHD